MDVSSTFRRILHPRSSISPSTLSSSHPVLTQSWKSREKELGSPGSNKFQTKFSLHPSLSIPLFPFVSVNSKLGLSNIVGQKTKLENQVFQSGEKTQEEEDGQKGRDQSEGEEGSDIGFA
jgi:hypothetical protein